VVTAQGANAIAYDAATGKQAWTAATTGAAIAPLTFSFSGGCVTGVSSWSPVSFGGAVRASTSLAAARASETLVVAAGTTVQVISLVDGKEQWSGPVTGAKGALRDPVLVGKRVYVMDGEGVFALDAK
jgi:outer membrane protein assembly factor BamB